MNLIVAEFLGLGLALLLIFRTDLRHMEIIWQEVVALSLALLFPILFFPYSRSAWMALDLTFHPPGATLERQLRGNLTRGEDGRD